MSTVFRRQATKVQVQALTQSIEAFKTVKKKLEEDVEALAQKNSGLEEKVSSLQEEIKHTNFYVDAGRAIKLTYYRQNTVYLGVIDNLPLKKTREMNYDQ